MTGPDPRSFKDSRDDLRLALDLFDHLETASINRAVTLSSRLIICLSNLSRSPQNSKVDDVGQTHRSRVSV